MHAAVILNCCSCGTRIFVDVVQLVFAGLTTGFAFLAIAMARANSLSDQKMSLLSDRAKMIEIYQSLMNALKTGRDKVLEEDVSKRTDFQLGFEWFGDVIRLQNYSQIARSLGYEKSEDDLPSTVYRKGRDEIGNLVRQAHYLFSSDIKESWENLAVLFEKYGKSVSKPEQLPYKPINGEDEERIRICLDNFSNIVEDMERESRPTVRLKPFSIGMLKELLG